MKRSTLSLLLTAAILLVGGLSIWFLILAPRLRPAPAPTPVAPTPVAPQVEARHDALNLYLAAPGELPPDAARVELTLVKATLSGSGRADAVVFEGVRKVVLQPEVVEKALSELAPSGAWDHLTLEFSPAAEIAMKDGRLEGALLEQPRATLTFEADLPISRSLALFARLPLSPTLRTAGTGQTAGLLADPQKAESYVFGAYLLDERGRGDVWTVKSLTLADAVMADLGLDIRPAMKGSQGFNPAQQAPTTPNP